MKTVEAQLCIQVHVECPECEDLIDLLDSDDTNGYDHDDDGFIIRQAGSWGDGHDNFECEDVTCSNCKTTFNVKEIVW